MSRRRRPPPRVHPSLPPSLPPSLSLSLFLSLPSPPLSLALLLRSDLGAGGRLNSFHQLFARFYTYPVLSNLNIIPGFLLVVLLLSKACLQKMSRHEGRHSQGSWNQRRRAVRAALGRLLTLTRRSRQIRADAQADPGRQVHGQAQQAQAAGGL